MLIRKIYNKIESWFNSENKALLIDGARQVGKTTSIKYFLSEKQKSNMKKFNYLSFNLLEDKDILNAFNTSSNAKELLLRLSSFTNSKMIPGQTIIFIDEIQEADDGFTIIKYLIEEKSYRYIFSGSLLGIKIKDIASFPVGFLQIEQMFPLDFEEFLLATNINYSMLDYIKDCYDNLKPVDVVAHKNLLKAFSIYLIVGGMPEAVDAYIKTNNLQNVINVQKSIDTGYLKDISKYDKNEKLLIKDIYNLIPSELNSQNKRFILKELNQKARFYKYESSFAWIANSGTGLFVYNVDDPKYPLLASKERRLFKLFPSDIGLLSYKLLNGNQIKILNGDLNINFGSFYESVVAQELSTHNFNLYYHTNKKRGEIDFLIEKESNVIPIEVKSGKDYNRHSALNNLLENKEFNINKAIILSNSNLEVDKNKIYLPIYMIMFLQNSNKIPDTELLLPKINFDITEH